METLKIKEIRKYITFEEPISSYFLDDVIECIKSFGDKDIFEDGVYITIEEFIAGVDRFLDHAITKDDFIDWAHLASIVSYPSSFYYNFGIFCRKEYNDLIDFFVNQIDESLDEDDEFFIEEMEGFKEDLYRELTPINERHYQSSYPLAKIIKETMAYDDHNFTKKDIKEFKEAIDKLGEVDPGRSYFFKGFLKYLGLKSEKRNYKEALSYFELSIKNGCFESLSYVGRIYFEGLAGETDYKKALEYFSKADVMDNDIYAKVMIARSYFEGKGAEKDKLFALKALDKMESLFSDSIDSREYDINYETVAYYFSCFIRKYKYYKVSRYRLISMLLRAIYVANIHFESHYNVYGSNSLIDPLEAELSRFKDEEIDDVKHDLFYLYLSSNDVRNLIPYENYKVELENDSGTFIGKFMYQKGSLYTPTLVFVIEDVLMDNENATKMLEVGDEFEVSFIHPALNIELDIEYQDDDEELYKIA